jgi:hypothetical protein
MPIHSFSYIYIINNFNLPHFKSKRNLFRRSKTIENEIIKVKFQSKSEEKEISSNMLNYNQIIDRPLIVSRI